MARWKARGVIDFLLVLILVGAPARHPDLVCASRKTDGGAAERST